MKVSLKSFIALLLGLTMLLFCLACDGGGSLEPFTRPPATNDPHPSSTASTAPKPSETQNDEAAYVQFRNDIGSELIELYISSSELGTWGEPVYYGIASGETIQIRFLEFGGVPGEKYDIGTIDEKGINYDCFDVALIDGYSITLSGNSEKADYVFERTGGNAQTVAAQVYTDGFDDEKRSAFIQPYLSTASDYSEISTNRYGIGVSTSFTSVRLNARDAEKFPMLDRALTAMNERRTEASSEIFGDFSERAGEASLLSSLASFPVSEFKDDAYVFSSDETVLSMLFVHGETINGQTVLKYDAAAFDPETGAQLMLSDVAADIQKLEQGIYAELEKAYGEIPFDEDAELISEFSAPSDKLAWTIEPSGLRVFINGAPFGAESEVYSVFISFSDYNDIIYTRFVPKCENYAFAFPLDFELRTSIEGKLSSLKIIAELDDEPVLKIAYNAVEQASEINSVYEVKPYFVHSSGRDLLYLDMLSDNDYRFLSVYSLEDDAIVHLGEFYGSWGYTYETSDDAAVRLVQPMVDPESFALYSRTELLGTADGTKIYSVGDDGLPKTEDKYFLIIRPDIEFALKQPLSFHLVTEAGDIDVSTVLLEAGTALSYFRTDGSRFADLALEDGSFVRAIIDDGCIDSVPIEELFEGIVFSG